MSAKCNQRIMILAPHADDAELGCGGYMARQIADGAEVLVVVTTVSKTWNVTLDREVSLEERVGELKVSMSQFGLSLLDGCKYSEPGCRVLYYGSDGAMHTRPMSEVVHRLDTIREGFLPDVILIPLSSAHQDHRYTWDVGVAMCRPTTTKVIPKLIAAYEYPFTSWGDGAQMKSFNGGYYVNITDTLEVKKKALMSYSTQMRESGDLLSLEGVETLAKLRGLESGYKYAELFHILRARMD